MHPQSLPLDLHRANAGLQWRIGQLLRESDSFWLEAAHGFGAGKRIDKPLRAGRGKSTSSEALRLLLRDEAIASRVFTRLAVQGQIAFTNGMQQALLRWRDGISEAFAGNVEAAPFVDVFRQWAHPWIAATTATPAQAGTDWRKP